VVLASFIRFGSSCRDDADDVASHGVGDRQQAAIDHACRDQPAFSIVASVVQPFDGERIAEHQSRGCKADAVFGKVLNRLGSSPSNASSCTSYGTAVGSAAIQPAADKRR